MKHALLLCAAFAAVLPAQTQVTVPNVPSVTNVDRPFPGGIGRYQQWYSANSIAVGLGGPMRIERLEFFAGTTPTSQAAQIDCEILMCHGKQQGVTGSFGTNYDSPLVTVIPRAMLQLNAGGTGAVVMNLPFTNRFTWDGARPLLIEIRIFGNSLGNQPFAYNFRGSSTSVGVVNRVYQAGSTGAPTGAVLNGVGMVTRFTAIPGIVLPFGTGCPGEGGFVPQGQVGGVPRPGVVWQHQLTGAASQAIAIWVFGDTNQAPFPVDLTTLLGLPPSNCMLRTNPLVTSAQITVGGGAGGGAVSLPVPLPATTGYVGLSFFTQWVVLDPAALNGVLSVTGATWSIVAP